jgi:thioredoxin reductase (NADPH)
MSLRVLVVGAGPAGVAAAVQLRRLGADVRWWDRGGVVGGLLGNAWRVENWPGVPVGTPGPGCCDLLREHVLAFGLAPEPVEATGVVEDDGGVMVGRARGGPERFDAVVWAVGTAPVAWELARPDLPVLYEYAALPARAGRVLFVGGGEAACDGALRAAGEGRSPTLVVRSDRLRARGRLADLTMAHPGIDRRFSTEVTALASAGSGVAATLRARGASSGAAQSAIEVDAVCFCGGRESRLSALSLPAPAPGSLRISQRQWVVGDARLGGLGQACIALGDGLLAAMEIMAGALIRWD